MKLRKSRPVHSRDELAAEDERDAVKNRGTTPIGQVQPRSRVRISGVLQALTYLPATRSAQLRGSLYDGSGSLTIIWMGRRDVPGIKAGVHLMVNGMVGQGDDGLVIRNPDYQILNEVGHD